MIRKAISICAFSLIAVLGFTNLATGQNAPVQKVVKAAPGDWVRIPVPELTNIDKATAVLGCYPANDNWEVLTKFDGSAILAIQSKEDKVFLFTLAGTSTAADSKGKLVVLTIILDQTPAKPDPDKPKPKPKPDPTPGPSPASPYADQLKSAYLVSPNADALAKLVNIFSSLVSAIDDDSINGADKLKAVLVAAAVKELGADDIKLLRSEIAKILLTELPPTAPWDKAAASKVLGNLLAALKAL